MRRHLVLMVLRQVRHPHGPRPATLAEARLRQDAGLGRVARAATGHALGRVAALLAAAAPKPSPSSLRIEAAAVPGDSQELLHVMISAPSPAIIALMIQMPFIAVLGRLSAPATVRAPFDDATVDPEVAAAGIELPHRRRDGRPA